MELKINVNKIRFLDSKLTSEMLDNNDAVIGTIDGRTVLLTVVDLKDIIKQVEKKEDQL
ncbi:MULTISPECIES: hypothetical protein [Bacillota]|uniref:hypothetical protein n=1 Tax=Bacillota TaxID=1239 RepID=UPI000A8A2E14|nr:MULTISPECIES: hypothetical protein [Bacillota]GIN25471.1 hypothetical protein J31TS2_20510 [Bacillus licheniformis]GIN29790.1 hypothetical protein J2TS5_18290 [Bacillus licheniformis]HZH58462.1 hypothetical protein [Metabacillus sp.]